MSVSWAEFCWMLVIMKCSVYWGLLQEEEDCTSAGKKKVGISRACTRGKAPPRPQRQLARPCFSHIESKPSHHIHTQYIHHLQLTCAEANQPHSLTHSHPLLLSPFRLALQTYHNGSAVIATRVAADRRDVDHSHIRAPVLLPILSIFTTDI
jgi:hypothetical protein